MKNLEQYPIVRDIVFSEQDLVEFEDSIVQAWETAQIRGPVHLSSGNEAPLIEIFKRIKPTDWVFSTWRSHYHAMLKGVEPEKIRQQILAGKSISVCSIDDRFYSSAIVGGTLSIALGVAMAIKQANESTQVWCFIGDMSFESGLFYETHKYARNFDLPIRFVIENNGVSTYTPTDIAWGGIREIPNDVIHYDYKSKYPHYGTGKWVVF